MTDRNRTPFAQNHGECCTWGRLKFSPMNAEYTLDDKAFAILLNLSFSLIVKGFKMFCNV